MPMCPKGPENVPKILAIEGLAMLGGGVLVLAILSPEFWHVLYFIIQGVATVSVVYTLQECYRRGFRNPLLDIHNELASGANPPVQFGTRKGLTLTPHVY